MGDSAGPACDTALSQGLTAVGENSADLSDTDDRRRLSARVAPQAAHGFPAEFCSLAGCLTYGSPDLKYLIACCVAMCIVLPIVAVVLFMVQ